MNFYLVSGDGDDLPQEPLMAEDVAQAADLYVQAVLEGRACIDVQDLRRGLCIFVGGFVPPEGGAGLMPDTVATSVPMNHIPSWRAFNAPKSDGFENGPS